MKRPTKDTLVELCNAHEQLVQTKKDQEKRSDASHMLIEMFDAKLRDFEKEITNTLKTWLSQGKKS